MSKEPNINEEKIAIEKAIRKDQRTIDDYVVNRLENLERTVQQQDALIKNYEKVLYLIKLHAEVGTSGWVAIRFYDDSVSAEVIKILGLEKGNKNE